LHRCAHPTTPNDSRLHNATQNNPNAHPKKTKKRHRTVSYEILTRTADGDEGGRHQIISAGVAGGKLWILKVQVGDKRWFKGTDKDAMGAADSFTLA